MNTNQLLLAYPDSENEIRTICVNDDVFFCLYDIVKILAQQNIGLAKGGKTDGLIGLQKALIEVLEPDESERFEDEPYVTQPGLFRIILRDNSKACKKFQKWVLKDVLPSIQKYGTYPPPLVNQDSDIKRVVKTLLLEIEQREELEKQTKEQFSKHEKMLNSLGSKLESLSNHNDYDIEFSSITDYCNSNDIDRSHEQLLRGWCIKICAEQSEPTRKTILDGYEIILFPIHVISSASKTIM